MDLIEELMQEITLNNFDVGSSTWVDVTYINNPHSFYVRPTSYRSFLKSMQAHGQKLEQQDLQLSMNIVYYSKTLKNFCRGLIYHIDTAKKNCTCDIYAIDYGCVEKSVSLKNMYSPLLEQGLPPLATHCQLANCEPKNGLWKDKEIDAMKCYIGTEKAKLIVKGKTCLKLIVELFNSCPDDIATMLALTGYSTLGYNENVISRIPNFKQEKHYYTYPKIEPGNVLHVRTQSGKDLDNFYVAKVDEYYDYINNVNNLLAYSKQAQSLRPEDMKENKAISVFVPQFLRYERGIIQKITVSEEKALVQLVDWGFLIEADVSRMKTMSEYYFLNPVIAIYCTIEKSKQFDTSLQKFLHTGCEFLITIEEVGNEFDKPNIVSISPLPKLK
ncbi:PREDICTED: uncharacterized protein LOC106126740 [Papilio xuthus]|uniref:Uncharacterized protein LOC106126740 n=1 Tax=Papilio xuthus TaxID=66420 RepID=A0AAJ7EJT1_PAPXU|nr:PREDICTED: uncharacterized protein LOC106126740 [Papilio xuthus]